MAKTRKSTSTPVTLSDHFQELRAAGAKGFEGLVVNLLSNLTGLRFYLSQSGQQRGRDAKTSSEASTVVAVEAKRYASSTKLDERELVAELHQAVTSEPSLDLWILATSRSVPEQLLSSLEKEAEGRAVGLLVMDSLPYGMGALDILAASSPETVRRFFPESLWQELDLLLNEIRNREGFEARVQELKQQVLKSDTGWPCWRDSANRCWNDLMQNASAARARFGQSLAVLAPDSKAIPREDVSSQLNTWWEQQRSKILFVVGEEGDGKTWAVAEWISSRLSNSDSDLPPVLFVPSREAGTFSSFEELVEMRLRPTLARDIAAKKIKRWRQSSEATDSGPLALVILDGLNERESPAYWRAILESKVGTETGDRIALLCTVRESYWKSNIDPLNFLPMQQTRVPSFSDQELRQALALRGKTLEEFPAALWPLLSKPRYLDLAVQHSETMAESGDITVARLIFEDWRDRISRRDRALSSDEFNDLLKQLASESREGKNSFASGEVRLMLSSTEGADNVIRELSTGGVLNSQSGRFKVDATRLPQGLGLLLADRLAAVAGNESALREEMARWLEPNTGLDLTSASLEHAFLCAARGSFALDVIELLLSTWLKSQNPRIVEDATIEDSVVAYLPMAFEAYIGVAEQIWGTREDNPWSQEVFLKAFIQWANRSDKICTALLPILERWTSMVPFYGHPIFKSGSSRAANPEISLKLKEAFGNVAPGQPCRVGDYTLIPIEDDLSLRLSHTALVIISHVQDRRSFIRTLVAAMLVDSITQGASHDDDLQWIIRSAKPTLDALVSDAAQQLIDVGTTLAMIAGSRLLRYVGTEPAWKLRGTLDLDTLFPKTDFYLTALENPIESPFTPIDAKQIEEYAQRPDLNPFNFLRKVSDSVNDPNLVLPNDLPQKLESNLETRKREKMWSGMWRNEEDAFFESAEVMFARIAPQRLATFIRQVFQTAPARDDQGFLALSHRIEEYDLLLDDDTRKMLYKTVETKPHLRDIESDTAQFIECHVFAAALSLWKGDLQLQRVRARSSKSFNWVELTRFFRGPVTKAIPTPTTEEDWFRTVHYLAEVTNPILSAEQAKTALEHQDSLIRGVFLQYIYDCDVADSLPPGFTDTWTWNSEQDSIEQTYGSLLKIDLMAPRGVGPWIDTVAPHHRAWALEAAGATIEDWKVYGAWITRSLAVIGGPRAELSPRRTVQASNDPDAKFPDRVSADHEESGSIRFVAQTSVWGGRFSEWPPKLFPSAEEHRETAMQANDQIRAQEQAQNAAGNYWMHRNFPRRGLDRIAETDRTTIESWIDGLEQNASLAFQAMSFGISLHSVLFTRTEWHELAKRLHHVLRRTSSFTRYSHKRTGLEFIDEDLFAAPISPVSEDLWAAYADSCRSDDDLLKLTLLARLPENSASLTWLGAYAKSLMESDSAFDRAKGLTLRGFLERDPNAPWLVAVAGQLDDVSWLEEIRREALRRVQAERAARHWFKQFCILADPAEAWSGYRLFLMSADRRCLSWCWQELEDSQASLERRNFFAMNFQNVTRKMKDNEKKLGELFLGCKVRENLFPWMTIL